MDELAEKIKSSIENRYSDPWFPELTAALAASAWDSLHRDIGLTRDIYGTQRVLTHNISAPREIIRSLMMPALNSTELATSIESLSQGYAVDYQKKGASLYPPAEIDTTVLSCLEEALAIINQVPSLMRTVAILVRSLHLLKPEDEEHDVSFSEPRVPFSIFVSVPSRRIQDDRLRVAEAVVHEAMHLQLTLIEQKTPLVRTTHKKYYSPWRATYRPVQGVLHGVYVFRVIDSFLAQLISLGISSTYVEHRREVINKQILDAQSVQDSLDFTPVGARLIGRLVDRSNSRVHEAYLAP